MERTTFEYDVLTHLRLSREEVDRLSKACERHYDGTVKSLTIPGKNACLNAARNDLEFGGRNEAGECAPRDFAEIRISSHQLDTLCKAVEQPMDGNFDLYLKLRELLLQSHDEWKRLNKEPA